MRKKVIQSGKVDNRGRLQMFMGEVNQFLSYNKGKTIIATFEVFEPNTSEAMKGYYKNYILPTIQKAMYQTGERMSLEDVDTFLLSESAYCESRTEDLSRSEFIEYIDWIKQYAAENFNVYIEDPSEL